MPSQSNFELYRIILMLFIIAPHCVELGHIQPARISDEIRQKINEVIPVMLDALKYNNGPSHTEILIFG